jgi:hypothetical protein
VIRRDFTVVGDIAVLGCGGGERFRVATLAALRWTSRLFEWRPTNEGFAGTFEYRWASTADAFDATIRKKASIY